MEIFSNHISANINDGDVGLTLRVGYTSKAIDFHETTPETLCETPTEIIREVTPRAIEVTAQPLSRLPNLPENCLAV